MLQYEYKAVSLYIVTITSDCMPSFDQQALWCSELCQCRTECILVQPCFKPEASMTAVGNLTLS